MPIGLPGLPQHLQIQILQKINLSDYISLNKSSNQFYHLRRNLKTRIKINTDKIVVKQLPNEGFGFQLSKRGQIFYNLDQLGLELHIKILVFKTKLSDFTFQNLLNFFEVTNSSASEVKFTHDLQSSICSLEKFSELIEVSKSRKLEVNSSLPPEYFRLPVVQNLPEISFKSPISDEDLTNIQAYNLVADRTDVTSRGINQLLKQWMNNLRDIKNVRVLSSQDFLSPVVLEGVPHEPYPQPNENSSNSEFPFTSLEKFVVFNVTRTKRLYLDLNWNWVTIISCKS